MSKESSLIIQITFSNGEVFEVEADFIAANRAEYYARSDCRKDPLLIYEDVYRKEFEYARCDKFELKDWIDNNMNWRDIAPHARLQPARVKAFNYHEEFSDATVKVVNNPSDW